MAFSTKFGGVMRQIVSQNRQVPMTSMLNSVRYMSSKLFVGGISFQTDEQSLREAFSSFGDVTDVKVIQDRDTGRSRGFGFVSFSNEGDASSAMSAMDGQELNGRNIHVSVANERPRNFGSSGGGNFGRQDGGFGRSDAGY